MRAPTQAPHGQKRQTGCKAVLASILNKGQEKASESAKRTLKEVRDIIGFYTP
jgi:hypothetical protein